MPEYSQMPVVEVIDAILGKIKDAPCYSSCRHELAEIRDGIFMELPEDRCRLLCAVGRVINAHVPVDKLDSYHERFWYEIREIMDRCLAQYRHA